MQIFQIEENGIYMVWKINDENEVKLLHFSSFPYCTQSVGEEEESGFRLVEVALSGVDRPEERHGIKYTVTAPGYRMKYDSHKDYTNELGRKLEIVTADRETGIYVTSHFQFYQGIPIVKSFSTITNQGDTVQVLEYISSFNLNGIEKEGLLPQDMKMKVGIVHNSWQRELQWKEYSLPQLGIEQAQPASAMRSSKAIQVSNTGNWSTKEYLPMGCVINEETSSRLFWQIEHNGSWHWEISDQTNHLYVQLSGPTENQSHWFRELRPGDCFGSVPAAVGAVCGNAEVMIKALTDYRRMIRRKNNDNEKLGIIFNDYMNCLWAEPTTEKELPLIDAAANMGCEYYCIDAGWYADGYWWDETGEWMPSDKRFPGGIKEVIDYIRSKGMIPGLWLELEVMGIKCPKVEELPEKCFFHRHGKRVYDRSRYQLDFRQPEVTAHADAVIDRLVKEYGVGYIKMDYNIEPGIGTEVDAESFGEGLLGHERAYLKWIDSIFEKYPELIIENCSSGGLRMDYAMLKRHSIQSTSDQEDYIRYATIAANSPLGVTMEQAAIWAYPRLEGDEEETIFNMVNAMLLRVHQSGQLAEISGERKELVKAGLDYYKKIRVHINRAYPFWPLGFSAFGDDWVSLGIRDGNTNILAIWRRGGCRYQTISIPHLKGKEVQVALSFPSKKTCQYKWNRETGTLSVDFPLETMARIFELVVCG